MRVCLCVHAYVRVCVCVCVAEPWFGPHLIGLIDKENTTLKEGLVAMPSRPGCYPGAFAYLLMPTVDCTVTHVVCVRVQTS